jgi:hypothetical protein
VVESWPARLVGERAAAGGVAYAVQTVVNGGSEPLIFVPRAGPSHDRVATRHRSAGCNPQILSSLSDLGPIPPLLWRIIETPVNVRQRGNRSKASASFTGRITRGV